MSTQSDSLIRVSRKKRQCAGCDRTLYVGDKYLSYAPGQRTRIPFCTMCMIHRCPDLKAVMDYRTEHRL